MSCVEHTVHNHAVDVKVRFYFVVAQVQHLLLHLSRIVETVVRLQLEVGSHLLAGKLLDGLGLGLGLWCVLSNQLLQEVVHIVRVFSHRALQRVRGVVLITHQFGLLGTQLSNLHYQGEGVVLIRAVGTMT